MFVRDMTHSKAACTGDKRGYSSGGGRRVKAERSRMSKRKQGRRRSGAEPPPRRGQPAAAESAYAPISGTLHFAAAIFTGALLLFLVQPLIAKYLLPWFGGSPGVWAT